MAIDLTKRGELSRPITSDEYDADLEAIEGAVNPLLEADEKTLYGRAAQAGTGAPSFLSDVEIRNIVGEFTSTARGLAPASETNDHTQILWDDGWGSPPAESTNRHVIQEDGSNLTARANLNFGTGLSAADNSSNDATDVTLASHSHTVSDITDAGDLAALDTVGSSQIDDEAVTNAKLAHMAQSTIKGRAASAGTGDATDLTAAQVVAVISGTIDAGDVAVDTYGDLIESDVQTSFQNLEDAIDSLDDSSFLSPTANTDDFLEPVSGNYYLMNPSGGEGVVILNTDFASPGASQLKLVGGAVRIIPGPGATLNGSNRVSDTDAVTDAVFADASGATITITSATSDLADYAEDDIIVISDAANPENNGYFLVGATHATNDLDLTKIANSDGSTPVTNPSNAVSEAISINLLDPINLKSITTIRRITASNFEVIAGTDEDKDNDGSNLTGIGSQFLDEKAAADTDVAGDGQIWVKSDTPNNLYFTDDAGTDFKLNGGKVLTSVSGSLTYAAHHGNTIVTSGNVTVPNAASDVGFQCNIIAGGAHTVTFNSTTSAAMAAGDVMTVLVQSTTVIKAALVEAADLVSFT